MKNPKVLYSPPMMKTNKILFICAMIYAGVVALISAGFLFFALDYFIRLLNSNGTSAQSAFAIRGIVFVCLIFASVLALVLIPLFLYFKKTKEANVHRIGNGFNNFYIFYSLVMTALFVIMFFFKIQNEADISLIVHIKNVFAVLGSFINAGMLFAQMWAFLRRREK